MESDPGAQCADAVNGQPDLAHGLLSCRSCPSHRVVPSMTPLQKTLKRALSIDGRDYVLAISPEGLKLVPKGKRKGVELKWEALVNGEAALAAALNASVGQFAPPASISR